MALTKVTADVLILSANVAIDSPVLSNTATGTYTLGGTPTISSPTVTGTTSFPDGSASTPSIFRAGDTNTGVFFPAADTLAASTGGSERMRIDSSGNVKFVGSISVGNATPTTSGAGITFPATQSASSDANTLDDYEEGTWTPRIENVGASQVVTLTNAGRYVKVGRLVWATINAYATNTSAITATSHMYLRGLPFAAETSGYVGSVMSQYPSQPVSLIDIDGTGAPMYVPSGAQDWTGFTRNSWGGATSISWRMSFCYQATA